MAGLAESAVLVGETIVSGEYATKTRSKNDHIRVQRLSVKGGFVTSFHVTVRCMSIRPWLKSVEMG
jgi:hypothetical protein